MAPALVSRRRRRTRSTSFRSRSSRRMATILDILLYITFDYIAPSGAAKAEAGFHAKVARGSARCWSRSVPHTFEGSVPDPAARAHQTSRNIERPSAPRHVRGHEVVARRADRERRDRHVRRRPHGAHRCRSRWRYRFRLSTSPHRRSERLRFDRAWRARVRRIAECTKTDSVVRTEHILQPHLARCSLTTRQRQTGTATERSCANGIHSARAAHLVARWNHIRLDSTRFRSPSRSPSRTCAPVAEHRR